LRYPFAVSRLLPVAETIESHGCSVVLRRVAGPHARELFLACAPRDEATDAGGQAEAIYRAILGVLEREGSGFASVVRETLFLRDLEHDLGTIRAARRRVLDECDTTHRPATTEIEQPPLDERARLEVSVHAIVANEGSLRVDSVATRSVCGCRECVRAHGLRVEFGREVHLHAGDLYGPGGDAYEQALAMFGVAEGLLEDVGMSFHDVVRTWIHLREMDRDYADLNRARREFFSARGIDPAPASTGIGGGPVPEQHDLCLGLHAVQAPHPPERIVMTAPTLNEASRYGADFVRGMRVEERNKIALHVSGTASIDEAGGTAHPGEFSAQADRMFVNVAALLEGQGATFDDVVFAITYLKRPGDAPHLERKLREAGFEGFPHVCVVAPICRPELLCETEALAVLPGSTGSESTRDE
jgi:enamine deaminase RidA (YjgF/YER057c/UK114 family)